MPKKGFVYLVGAGPGRPDLITLHGARCLAKADAVVLDALADRRLLEHCRPGVRVIDAGKRGHKHMLMKQPAINALLARLAAGGKTVVRLKGGDPYFFGRGGEEAEYLYGRGIPFEVVPGVSSVSAVPSYAGIPVTHRGFTSTVTVVTGHAGLENPYLLESRRESRRRAPPVVEWEKLSPHNTLVVLMGVGQLPAIVDRLARAGWPGRTPFSVTQWGTLPQQRTVTGTLADVVKKVRAAGLGAPAVIVAGAVVGLRPRLAWFEKLPLFGKTVLVTRAESQSSALARLLEADGAQVLESPAIEIKPLPFTPRGARRLRELSRYHGVLFTSANAVAHFAARFQGPWPAGTAVHAIGAKTAQALAARGYPVSAVATEAVSEALLESLGEVRGKRFLFPRAAEGRDVLVKGLRSAGAEVDLWPLYRTRPRRLAPEVKRALLAGKVDCVTFTSASTARSLLGQLPAARRRKIFAKTAAASIGPVTSKALRDHGVTPRVQAARATIEDLAAAVRARLGRKAR